MPTLKFCQYDLLKEQAYVPTSLLGLTCSLISTHNHLSQLPHWLFAPVAHQARQLVDELTTCWAMISLRRCAELGREMEISVPLYMGSIYDPTLLKKVFDEDRRLHPLRSFFTPERQPVLTFAAGPTPFRPQPLVAYRYISCQVLGFGMQLHLLCRP